MGLSVSHIFVNLPRTPIFPILAAMKGNSPIKLRSRDWFGKDDRWGLAHRTWLRAEGFSERVFEGKPVIGICNSWSELNNCNAHLRQVA